MLSISQNIHMCVSSSVCLFTFEVPFNGLFAPTSQIRCPIFLEIRNHWGKVKERSGLTFEQFVFCADFALQNMLETTLPDGLETSGRRVYR